jgi:hypothetical protein
MSRWTSSLRLLLNKNTLSAEAEGISLLGGLRPPALAEPSVPHCRAKRATLNQKVCEKGFEEDPAGTLSMVRKRLYVFGERAEGQEKIPAGGFHSVSSKPFSHT